MAYEINPSILDYDKFSVGDTVKFNNTNTLYTILGFSDQLKPMIFLLEYLDSSNSSIKTWFYAKVEQFTVVEKTRDLKIFDDPNYADLFE